MNARPPTHRLFDRYVFVDWSASARPNRGKDSIWFAAGTAEHTATPQNPATRDEATAALRDLLVRAAASNERVLIGFDFPYGYPAGFAAALRLHLSNAPWQATWSLLHGHIHDSASNSNRRFEDAAGLNRLIGGPSGPFWGHPRGIRDTALGWSVSFPFGTRHGVVLRALRHTELHLRSMKLMPFPVWKLYGQGAAGSQALLGIPRVAALRDDPRLAAHSLVWPFETGFSVDAVLDRRPLMLHAEVWPGVLEPDRDSHPVADARQVLALVEWARQLDRDGRLAREFHAPPGLDDARIRECVREEGWILGATSATPRSVAAGPPTAVVPGATAGSNSGVDASRPSGTGDTSIPRTPRAKARGQRGATVRIGYLNRNNQEVMEATGLPGTDHGQCIYVLRCRSCGTEYGNNGSGNFNRRCPGCQGGAPGLRHR